MTSGDALVCMVEAFLDHVDSVKDRLDKSQPAQYRIDYWYEKLNRAVDAVYREQSGIPPQTGIGRPIGSLDRQKRKSKLVGKYPFK